jgi:hypothetical protein
MFIVRKVLLSIAASSLVACGGGGGGSGIASNAGNVSGANSYVITGNAGSGASIVGGTVEVKCASGSGTATTAVDGSYSVTINDGVAPCLLRVTSSDKNFVFHSSVDSLTTGANTANISPLTELVVAKALGSFPNSNFTAGVGADVAAKLNTTKINDAVATIQQALPAIGVTLGSINPIKDTLQTDSGSGGNAQDKAIDALMIGLTSANKTVSDLTALVSSASTTTLANQSLTNFASSNQISTTTLSGCPYARSGKFLMAGPADRYFTVIDVDFSTNAGSFKKLDPNIAESSRSSQAITISQPDVTNKPCLFTFTPNNGNLGASVVITSSGLGVFSRTPSTNFPTNEFSGPLTGSAGTGGTANFLGIALPVQRLVSGQFDGNFKGISFYKTSQNSFYKVDFSRTQVTGNTLTGYSCNSNSGTCNSTADSTETVTANDDDYNNYGIYTSRASANSSYFTKSAIYRTAQGDKIVVSLIYGSGVDSAIAIATNRSTDMPTPVVGASASNYTWLVINDSNNAGKLYQKSYSQTFKINSVNGNTVTRSDASNETHTMTFNSPSQGMYKLSSGSNGTPAAIGITIPGFTVFAATSPSSTTAGDHFFGLAARY